MSNKVGNIKAAQDLRVLLLSWGKIQMDKDPLS